MSVFKVKLNNTQQGLLDRNPATGLQMDPSIQRTISVAGPRGIFRNLKDGDQFTDCNYWKRFAFPQLSLSNSFIEVVTDDGSVYSDDSEENTYALIFGGDTAYTVLNTDTYTTNFIDIAGTYGGFAKFVQISNLGTSSPNQDVKIEINGATNAILSLAAADTQVFNAGDLAITKLAFDGGVASTTLQIILSVKSVCNS